MNTDIGRESGSVGARSPRSVFMGSGPGRAGRPGMTMGKAGRTYAAS